MQDAALALANVWLKKCYPLNNGRHICMPISTSFSASQLNRLSAEVIIEIML